MVKFPALAVLLMVRGLPVIPVAELSRPTLAAPLMLSELPDTAPVTQAMAFEALKADVIRQVQAPRPRALGKSATEGPNDRLQTSATSARTRGGRRSMAWW